MKKRKPRRKATDFARISEIQDRLGVGAATINQLVAEGVLPAPRRLHGRPTATRIWYRPHLEQALARIAGIDGGRQ